MNVNEVHRLRRRFQAALMVLVATVAVGLALVGCSRTAVADVPVGTPPNLGDAFPYTRFLSGDGEIVDLDVERQDAQVMLVFMRGFDGRVCPFCTRQTANIISQYDELKAAGFKVFIVYPGAESSVPKFIEEVREKTQQEGDAPIPVPLLLDVDLRAVRTLGIPEKLAKPATFVIDRDGKLIYRYIGESMYDRPEIDDILKALRPPAADAPPTTDTPPTDD